MYKNGLDNVESNVDEQVDTWVTRLPDPGSYDAYDYLRQLNLLFREFNEKIALKLNLNIIRRLLNEEIVTPRLITTINRYRARENIDLNVIQGVVDIHVLLECLSHSFQRKLSRATIKYYNAELKTKKQSAQIEDFLSFVITTIDNEKNLLERINIPMEMRQKVIKRLIAQLLKNKMNFEQFIRLVKEKKYSGLRNTYQLYKTGASLNKMCALWEGFLYEQVDTLYEQRVSNNIHSVWRAFLNDQTFIFFKHEEMDMEDFIRLKNEYKNIVNECFEGNETMSKQFVVTMANYRPKPQLGGEFLLLSKVPKRHPLAEITSIYLHKSLKKASKEPQSVEEIESWFKLVAEIFPYLDEDMFFKFYKYQLSRRFIKRKSIAVEAERYVLMNMPGWWSKDAILRDIESKPVIDEKFSEYLTTKQINLDMSLEIKVSSRHWNIGKASTSLIFPPEFQRVMQVYNKFFHESHQRQKSIVEWSRVEYQTCELTGSFESGSKELFVTLQQALVLLLFNEHDELSVDEIVEKTNIGKKYLKRILFPILRSGIIVPMNSSNDDDEETYRYGKEFTSPGTKFDLTFGFKTDESEKEEVKFSDDDYKIQAAIVRLVKRHKEMFQHDLIREVRALVASQVIFKVKSFTRAIKSLTDREYLTVSDTGTKILIKYCP